MATQNVWRSVKVWMNAFIPLSVPGYTRVVPKGPFKNMTMIPGPSPVSDCFLTDRRGFSPFIQAKSRMHSEARVVLSGASATITEYHKCDWTTECDCEDGEQECHKEGKTENMKYRLQPSGGKGKVELWLSARAWNPCSPSSAIGGEIDMQATFVINFENKTINTTAIVDSFPAFEAYATINDGAGTEIFTKSPPKGNTVMNLPGNASTRIDTAELYDPGNGILRRRTTAGLPRFTTLASRIDLHERRQG